LVYRKNIHGRKLETTSLRIFRPYQPKGKKDKIILARTIKPNSSLNLQPMSLTQLKCKSCHHWNSVQNDQALCEACGQELNPIHPEDEASLERRKTTWEITVPIDPEASWFKRLYLNIFNVITLIFLGIVSFFVWLFAMGPG
jgi:hypothetical protein